MERKEVDMDTERKDDGLDAAWCAFDAAVARLKRAVGELEHVLGAGSRQSMSKAVAEWNIQQHGNRYFVSFRDFDWHTVVDIGDYETLLDAALALLKEIHEGYI